MNASGPHSAERGEIYELSARHRGAIVFKSCNRDRARHARQPQEPGRRATSRRSRATWCRAARSIVGSVVGDTEDEIRPGRERRSIARASSISSSTSPTITCRTRSRRSRPSSGSKRWSGACAAKSAAALAVKVPPKLAFEPRAIADLFKSLQCRIVVCANDLPKDLEIDIKTRHGDGRRPRAVAGACFLSRGRQAARYRRGRRNQHGPRRLYRASDRRQGGAGRLGADQGRRGRARPHRSRARCDCWRENGHSVGRRDHRAVRFAG